ncbi:predicted protein [Streptomyces viridosporus ATCC 14672]|uniref:Predicted protein n=1 Tax=Streptomyces viridosporus (strain ATCC 14672 / DSM 40746 / JCM 4963 / KCTC 9882 / NRRL B-12104 / FH 1290) TaxID=566461 RepID=D6A4E5_STRV1|nr:hypothetical protein [Streptomyces viridosporus]EFE65785.1 predicted protein [Streptomyces viridosporus ATCC 14672]
MTAIKLAGLDIRWSGMDSTTPVGHVLVLGVDSLGVLRLCLYKGSQPDDAAFRGSLLIPSDGHSQRHMPTRTTAYGPTGAFVTSHGDQTAMLQRLAGLAP